MIRAMTCARRSSWYAAIVVGVAACAGVDTAADQAEVAVSGGGVTVDVVTTNGWSGGFNGAGRITDNAFPSPITSFEVVFRLGGGASVSGTPWNGDISAPDGTGARAATQPSWLQFNPVAAGQTWEVGFPGSGVFAGSTIVSVRINGQPIVLGGGGGGDTTPPTVGLSASSATVTAAGTLTLTATATDNVGVTRGEFRAGSTVLGTDSSPPFTASVALTSANNGTHNYTAVAIGGAGNAATSTAVTVTVNIPGGSGAGTGFTTGSGKLFKDGTEIKLFGLNWFGLETQNHVLHGLWTGRGPANTLAQLTT